MKTKITLFAAVLFFISSAIGQVTRGFQPFQPPVSYEEAGKRADAILAKLSLEEKVQLIAVEAAGEGVHSGKSAATTQLGKQGVLHGSKSLVMQTEDGQVVEPQRAEDEPERGDAGQLTAGGPVANRRFVLVETERGGHG